MAGFVTISCPSCPRDLRVRPEHAGRRVACKYCASVFRVPTHVVIPCPKCGHEGSVRCEHIGRKVRCKGCAHAFRGRTRSPARRGRSDAEVARLRGEIDRRERRVEELRGQLDEARGELVALDSRAQSLRDGRDAVQRTEEWSIVDEEPVPDPDNGTEPDLPLADLDESDPRTRIERVEWPEPDTTPTRLAHGDDELAAVREERDRLRAELDRLHESANRTVIARGATETLERDLAVAQADNVRLTAELDEARRMQDGLMRLLRDRDMMIVELTRERDGSRAAFDLAENARLALVDELESLRAGHREPKTALERPGS